MVLMCYGTLVHIHDLTGFRWPLALRKVHIPYSSKFPWSNIFVIFVNFAIITKLFATKLS